MVWAEEILGLGQWGKLNTLEIDKILTVVIGWKAEKWDEERAVWNNEQSKNKVRKESASSVIFPVD